MTFLEETMTDKLYGYCANEIRHIVGGHLLCVTIVFLLFIGTSFSSYAGSFTGYSSAASDVERNPHRQKTEDCPYYTCGPTTVISLGIATPPPGMGLGSNYSTGESGFMQQMMKNRNPMANLGKIIAATDTSSGVSDIKITIPMIDYGYVGGFSNILIEMIGLDSTAYSSAVLDPETGDIVKFTGTVTIEYYSYFSLSGSYSGTLTSTSGSSGNISGDFNVLSPIDGDDRVVFDVKESLSNPMRDDLKNMMAQYGIDEKMDVDIDAMFDEINADIESKNSGRSGGRVGGSVYGDCNCSCNFVQTATPKCKTTCRAVFDVCEGDRYAPLIQQTVIDKNALLPATDEELPDFLLKEGQKFMNMDQALVNRFEKGLVQTPGDLRSKFVALLERDFPGSDGAVVRNMMIRAFDEETNEKSKMVMFISIGGDE
jgi:hypothetical protein